jgi:enoyl-CoA hydratase/carnithine racemase
MATARVSVPETLCPWSLRQLADALTQAIDDPAVHLVVLEGSETAFCRGLDFEQLVRDTDCPDSSAGGTPSPETAVTAFADCLNLVSLSRKPTLARIAGPALGGGVGLAAACDVVLADENASFALPELLFGLTPATIHPVLLGRMSAQQVRLWALQGKAYDARAAHAVGVVDEVVGAGELDTACRRWERTLSRAEPRAVAQLKRLSVEEVGQRREAVRRGAALTAAALTNETVLAPLRAFYQDGTPPWERP